MSGDPWAAWLGRSAVGPDLLARWQRAGGDDAFRERVVELLGRASARDCAAAGFGCTRRNDRPCRDPQVCIRDPDADTAGLDWRQGPVPGACGTFYGYWADETLLVAFGAGDQHRAVFWQRRNEPVALWVDGVRVEADAVLGRGGDWVAGRFLAVAAMGPDGHPAQEYLVGMPHTRILSLLVHDADARSTDVLVPAAGERWTDPQVRLVAGSLHVYPDRAAADAGRPDRTLPIA